MATDSPLWVYRKIELFSLFQVTAGFGEVVLLSHDVMFRQSNGGKAQLALLIDMLKDGGYDFDFISGYRGSRGGWRFPPKG
jgi:hypothetical protein